MVKRGVELLETQFHVFSSIDCSSVGNRSASVSLMKRRTKTEERRNVTNAQDNVR